MLFHNHHKNFPEYNKEWEIPHMAGPCLNNQQLLKNLPPRITSALWHMDQKRKNLQSTKHVKSEVEVD